MDFGNLHAELLHTSNLNYTTFNVSRRWPRKLLRRYGRCSDIIVHVFTFFRWTFWAALPSFLDRVMAAEFRTLDQRTADFAIIALAFGSAGAWGPALTMSV